MRKSGRPGRVYHRCGCRDADRRQLSAACPRLAEEGHGTWTFAVDIPSLSGHKRTIRRGGFEDAFAAETALRRFLDGRQLGFDADPHETGSAYLTKWLKSMEFLLKPTTYARYRTYVLCELIPVFGKLRLEELAHDHITAYAHEQLDAGRGHQAVYQCLATLSSALGTAVRTHRLPFNSAQPLPMRRPRLRRMRPLDRRTGRRLLLPLPQRRPRLRRPLPASVLVGSPIQLSPVRPAGQHARYSLWPLLGGLVRALRGEHLVALGARSGWPSSVTRDYPIWGCINPS
ncbi:N-terminal phage integrase SAM-like domain-containing protein [Kitasatospora purpeofusca]|uniref:hypothetical protein n=1 Tax=Kitasatospora purpeofusca TaxID=67352 RepID=UPI0022511AD5|nr:hypothetical protein [Kitasatospora purpeofusca]MCX4690271.1 N-terminal phage integrase SAM-like domain-containing protein [Kitasatospora purpeofusca]